MKRTIPLGDIVRSKELQVRKLDQEHVDDLAQAYEAKEEIEPLRVWLIKGRPNHWLTRGFHRIASLVKLGKRGAECEIKSGTFEEAFADALSGNQGHGKRMSIKDKRDAAQKAIKQFPDWADRRIADLIGVSHTFISDIREAGNVARDTKKALKNPSVLKTAHKELGKTIKVLPIPQTADDWLAEVIRKATAVADAIKQQKKELF